MKQKSMETITSLFCFCISAFIKNEKKNTPRAVYKLKKEMWPGGMKISKSISSITAGQINPPFEDYETSWNWKCHGLAAMFTEQYLLLISGLLTLLFKMLPYWSGNSGHWYFILH